MDSFKRATEMIIKLQDDKMELRLALGNLFIYTTNSNVKRMYVLVYALMIVLPMPKIL